MSKHPRQTGFTIIELLIASSVFAVILILVMTAFVTIGRMYYKGITAARTQEAARSLIDDISRELQFGTTGVETRVSVSDPSLRTMCIGTRRYAYVLHKRRVDTVVSGATETQHVLRKDSPGSASIGCPVVETDADLQAPVTEMVEKHMRLAKFEAVEAAGTSGRLWNVSVKIIYGEDDLLEGVSGDDYTNATCKGSAYAGSQFCAVSELITTVYRRLE
jgi:prepilin-type N-terminal cleavage/methylation domain-containing protein